MECNKIENLHAMPLVCSRWRRIMQTPQAIETLWKKLEITLPTSASLQKYPLHELYRWIQIYGAFIESLTVEINGIDGWTPLHALLGFLGPRLTSLRIYSDNDDAPAFERHSAAPWLALTPNLRALELEGVVDITIERADFPSGVTHLALNGCGQNGLHRIPEVLASLSSLHSLSLQFMEPGADVSGLSSLQHLRHLDLSNCSLKEVPEEVTLLPSLTSLTLNNNEELGGRENEHRVAALAQIPNLAVLELRDCALNAIPQSIAELKSLRKLLLGYNDFSAPVIIPPGPYLNSLQLLAMSDSMPENTNTVEKIVRPLLAATALQVLRINRNWGVTLTTIGVAALLKGKPNFWKLEYSEDMGTDLDIQRLKEVFPGVAFKLVE